MTKLFCNPPQFISMNLFRKQLLSILLVLVSISNYAQQRNNNLSIAYVFKKKCSVCHNSNETVPFELCSYDNIIKHKKMITYVIQQKLMPPWNTDPHFKTYSNELALTENEKLNLLNWLNNDCPKSEWKEADIKPTDSIKRVKSGLIIHMNTPYTVKPSTIDDFRWFPILYNFDSTIHIKSIRLNSNNHEVLHHCELFKAPKRKISEYFGCTTINTPHIGSDKSVKETKGMSFFADKKFVAGRFPGFQHQRYPKGIANVVSDTNFLMYYAHYSPFPSDSKDSSWIEIEFSNNKNDRPFIEYGVHAFQSLINPPFIIEPDSIKTFYCIKELDTTLSVFSCLPHAHHLCKRMMAYAISPNNDTLPIIKIDKWDFNWQWVYEFDKFLVLKKGTKIHFWATYDNTSQNPDNPYNPPQTANLSFDAKDEMMTLFLQSVTYQKGDESIQLKYE